MATPVFCCGFECGVSAAGHFTLGASASFSTSTVRSGARSLRLNPAAAGTGIASTTFASQSNIVARAYVYFASLPTSNTPIVSFNLSWGANFNVSDSKIYANSFGIGATGVSVTTGVWYRIDVKFVNVAGTVTVDVQVDGVACGQAVNPGGGSQNALSLGTSSSNTFDIFVDDVLMSFTAVDYPLGAGYVNHFVPTSDGTHNIAGTNDFEIGTGGVDILNATTTAYQLVDDIPLQSGAIGTTDFINMVAPTAATQYVECVFGPAPGISTPTAGPRAVDVIVGVAGAGGAANNMEVRLNDNGTMGTVYTHTGVTLTTTITYGRVQFADPPSAASVWTVTAGNGNFNNVRVRFGSPAVLDVAPDPYFASIMIEAEFAEVTLPRRRNTSIGHPFIF